MSKSESIWVKVQLKSPTEKFYGFFRNHLGDLVHMFPQLYKSCDLVEGQSYSSGSVVQFKVTPGKQLQSVKCLLKVVDDAKKYIIYESIEGDVFKYYKEFIVKLEVVNGGLNKLGRGSFAKWIIDFKKSNENVASPEEYLEMFEKISKGIDAYVSKN